MATDIIPLFGGQTHTTQQGQRLGGALAKQTRREAEVVAANVELNALRDNGMAFLAANAMTNVSTLVQLAEAHMKVAPAGAQFYEAIITGYAIGAGQRIAKGL